MRIGIYDPYLDDLGGGEKYMMTIASCFSRENDVDIFWDKREDVGRLIERFSLDLSNVGIVDNVFSPKISTLQRFLRTKKYDALFILSDGSIPLVGARKLFIHIQQPLNHLQSQSLLGKIKLSRVTAFFCNSLYTKSYLEKTFDIHPVVVYPPIAFFPIKAEKENIIVHVGRFRSVNGADYKKQSVMIQAFKEMVDKGFTDWKFIMATSVNEKDMDTFEKMRSSAKGYPIEFIINKPNKIIWELYSKAKIYWHASGFGEDLDKYPEHAEHFGMSTVEAMGAGAVPVVINAGGQREIVHNGENGFLWDSLEELEEKTIMLTKDKKLWAKLSKNAKQSVQRFSKERFCKEIKQMLDQ